MLTKRTLTAVAIAVFLFAPGAHSAADDSADNKTRSTTKTAATNPSAPAKEKASGGVDPVEAELQELKEAIAAQQATLQAQQERISYLEGQLHAPPPEKETSFSASSVGPVELPATTPSAVGIMQPMPAQSGGTAQSGGQEKLPLSFKIGRAHV